MAINSILVKFSRSKIWPLKLSKISILTKVAHFQLAVTSTKSQVVIVLHLKSCSYFVFQNWSKEGLLYKCFNYITFFLLNFFIPG